MTSLKNEDILTSVPIVTHDDDDILKKCRIKSLIAGLIHSTEIKAEIGYLTEIDNKYKTCIIISSLIFNIDISVTKQSVKKNEYLMLKFREIGLSLFQKIIQ